MTVLITGVAGFVGSNLARHLLARGDEVVGFDNLRTGSRPNMASVMENRRFAFREVELSDLDGYRSALREFAAGRRISDVWHLAANSDIPAGVGDPKVDLRDTFMTTFNTLALMRELGIGTICFASSSAVYGDHGDRELDEASGPLLPISNYGAMKLASEAAISASAESHLERAFIFRFPNVIGVPATHGVIFDFVHKLKASPDYLAVLGDGTQQKGYLHVDELVDAMLFVRQRSTGKVSCYNIGASDSGVTVRFIAEQVVAHLAPHARIAFGEGNKGWTGDVPKFRYSVAKLSRLGWKPRLSSAEAVRRAIGEIAAQESLA